MKRTFLSVFLLNLIMAGAMMVFVAYGAIKIDLGRSIPYEMSENYHEFSVFAPSTTQKEMNSLLQSILGLLKDNRCVLVFRGDNSYGLGLYDPQGYFARFPLKSGAPLTMDIQGNNPSGILIKENSYMQTMLIEDGAYVSNGARMETVGTYDDAYPLDTPSYDYIYPFSLSRDLSGVYSLDSADTSLYAKLTLLFRRNGYEFQYVLDPKDRSIKNLLAGLWEDKFFPGMSLGLIFIYANCFLFFYNALTAHKKSAYIHFRLGATSGKYFLVLSKPIFLGLVSGACVGGLLYLAIFSRMSANFPWTCAAALAAHLIISSLNYILAFIAHRFNANWKRGAV